MRPILPALLVTFLFGASLPAATFTVTSGANTGPGTLAQAILDANATPGRDQIVFAVTNVVTDPTLPAITDAVDIDGSVGPNRAEVGPSSTCDGCALFRFSAGSDGSTIRDLLLNDFAFYQLVVDAGVTGVVATNLLVATQIRIDGSNTTLDSLTGINASSVTFSGGGGNQLVNSLFPSGRVIVLASNTSIRDNIINATGALPGIRVLGTATGVEITGNSIVSGGLAIDLGGDGRTANDPAPDADTGPNALQNFPVLTAAYLTPSGLTVRGTLTSAPLMSHQIELFSSSASNPDARTFLTSFNGTTLATGEADFTITITAPLPAPGEVITATATNRSALATPGSVPNSTSEVSDPIAVTQPGVLGFDPTAYTVDEGAGNATFTVRRTGGSDGTVTVQYGTSNGTARMGRDFMAMAGTLTFAPGVTAQTFTIPIVDDTAIEGAETFTVYLGPVTGGATIDAATAQATATIVDNEAAAGAAIPTASEWGLLLMACALAVIGVLRR